jgi:hypothetical protein
MEARAQTYIAQFERHKMALQQRANIQTAVLVRELGKFPYFAVELC